MIKLVDILKEIEEKDNFIAFLDKSLGSTLPKTSQNTFLKRVKEDLKGKATEERINYFKNLWKTSKNFKLKYFALDMLNKLEGKKPW
jgi:hypothetical protein